MLTLLRSRFIPSIIAEAVVGRFEFRDVKGSVLLLDAELLVPKEELEQYEEEFGIWDVELPVKEPFTSWLDLIEAVKKRTPEAKKLIRYLEDYGYQDILKTRREVVTNINGEDVKQIKWENFLLPPFFAQGQGFKDGADYNRHMFAELRKFAPRALAPEGFDPRKVKGGLFGGQKIQRGTSGSKREMKKRREPMVNKIVSEHIAEIGRDLREIFSVLPEQWVDAILGPNQQNVTIKKDISAIHLGTEIETIPSNKDYRELERLQRVRGLLLTRQKQAADKATYEASLDEVNSKIEKLEETRKKYEAIYVNVAIKMGPFARALAQEANRVGAKEIGDGDYVLSTSLKNIPDLLTLLDPPRDKSTARKNAEFLKIIDPSYGDTKRVSRFGFSGDFNDFIKAAIGRGTGLHVLDVDRIERNGDIYFDVFDVAEHEAERPSYEDSLKNLASSEPDTWVGQRAAEIIKEREIMNDAVGFAKSMMDQGHDRSDAVKAAAEKALARLYPAKRALPGMNRSDSIRAFAQRIILAM